MTCYVPQRTSDDCLVACLAMVTELPYERVVELLQGQEPPLLSIFVDEVLANLGFAVMRRYMFDPLQQRLRDAWPPEPFASMHIAYTTVTSGYHGVVMLEDGSVLDPFKRSRSNLGHPDYQTVNHVDGVWRVRR